jgi:hypothetical protein
MITLSAEAMEKMAADKRAAREVPDVMRSLRERGDPLARRLDDDVLEREVRATLAACDRLRLNNDSDRLAFCMLEITGFAGLRDLPKLQGLLDYAGGAPEFRMLSLFAAMPSTLWTLLSERAADIRHARGLE